MNDSGIEHLSQLINPNTCGILWLTDEPLGYDSPGAYEVNYLLDGILTKTLEQANDSQVSPSNFFLGENFGKPFFVGQNVIKDKKDFTKVFDTLNVASPFITEGAQVYILNKSKNTANLNVLKELKSKNKHIDFEILAV